MNAYRITEIYAVLAENDDEEGIAGMVLDGGHMPMVFARRRNLEKMNIMAQTVADRSGKNVTVTKFTVREDIAKFKPGGKS